MKAPIIKTIEPFGNFRFEKSENQWFCLVKNFSPINSFELSIEVESLEQGLDEKVVIVKTFVNEIDLILEKTFDFVCKSYLNRTDVTINELRQMYFLTAIELKKDNKTWWIVLEPENDLEATYNNFLRFTLVNKEIIWSNLTHNE